MKYLLKHEIVIPASTELTNKNPVTKLEEDDKIFFTVDMGSDLKGIFEVNVDENDMFFREWFDRLSD